MILCVSRPGESPLNFCISRIGKSPSFLQVFSLPLAVKHPQDKQCVHAYGFTAYYTIYSRADRARSREAPLSFVEATSIDVMHSTRLLPLTTVRPLGHVTHGSPFQGGPVQRAHRRAHPSAQARLLSSPPPSPYPRLVRDGHQDADRLSFVADSARDAAGPTPHAPTPRAPEDIPRRTRHRPPPRLHLARRARSAACGRVVPYISRAHADQGSLMPFECRPSAKPAESEERMRTCRTVSRK